LICNGHHFFEDGIMKKTNFENLEIYQLSKKLADEIWKIVLTWSSLAQDTVGKQMIRTVRITSNKDQKPKTKDH
jgi:hypothetical protein